MHPSVYHEEWCSEGDNNTRCLLHLFCPCAPQKLPQPDTNVARIAGHWTGARPICFVLWVLPLSIINVHKRALHFFKIFHLDAIMENMDKFACTDLSSWAAMITVGFVDENLTAMETSSLLYELLHQIEICNRSLRVEPFCSAPKRLWSVTMSPSIFPAEWGATPCC